ncbi:MAG: dihydropteroate synthase [Candidatus Eremiobacteraeota bacterium]|nr:dihydropteroate synthase [Candidatus Eremiobacteraeota bacterium]
MSSSARAANGREAAALEVRGRRFVWGERTYLMGIVNATPDSFSGDGLAEPAAAIARALHFANGLADIVDVGAESTRPGSLPVGAEEECRRLLPVVRGIRERAPGAVLSIDTYKPDVFAAAHAAGGDVLNCISVLGDELLETAVARAAPIVIMHNKLAPAYDGDVVDEVLSYLEAQAQRAVRAGVPPAHVILDPGIGFGKTPDHNLAILGALSRFTQLGFPTLVGTSRKSTLGKLTGRPVGDRSFATAATVALAIAAKIDIVRVHDVEAMRDVARVSDAIVRGWRPGVWS